MLLNILLTMYFLPVAGENIQVGDWKIVQAMDLTFYYYEYGIYKTDINRT